MGNSRKTRCCIRNAKKALKDVKRGMEAVPTRKKFQVVQDMLKKEYSIQLLCENAGVFPSCYSKWIKRQVFPSKKQVITERTIKENIINGIFFNAS